MNDLDVSPIIESISNTVRTKNRLISTISGGFDSFVLTYMLYKLTAELNPSAIIDLWSINRPRRTEFHSLDVHNYFKERFPDKTTDFKSVGCPTELEKLHHKLHVFMGIRPHMMDLISNDITDTVIFLGDTKNPDIVIPHGESPTRDRPKVEYQSIYLQPFIEYDKRYVVLLAKEFGILDDACNLTHTCSRLEGRCNKCWQCGERTWAFTSLGINDTGIR
jgi:hypothetical protein